MAKINETLRQLRRDTSAPGRQFYHRRRPQSKKVTAPHLFKQFLMLPEERIIQRFRLNIWIQKGFRRYASEAFS